jgi:diguanylate cyclase
MAAALQRQVREIQEHLGQISRLSRVRAVLSGINSAILRIRDRDELLREACRIAVEEGEFDLAWVAETDLATGEIRVVARGASGGEEGGETVPEVLRTDGGMVAKALHTGDEVISNALGPRADGEGGDGPGALGYRSAASLPLRVGDRVVASLNLYTTEADFFTEEEIRLIRELTADTSLGLEYLEKEKQLHYLANYDPLTDLPNRALFTDRLRQAIGRGWEDHGHVAAVLLLGIDRFSEINASLGHQAGDLVIQTVASHLQRAAGEANTVARLASQDFGVILAAASGIREIERFANELLESVPRTLTSGSEEIFLAVRIGIAVFPHDGDDPDELVKAAALALEVAGSAPVQPVAFHSADLDAEARSRRKLEKELRGALAREELGLLYQPVVDLASGDPIGMEALLRWSNPDLGEVSPMTFIPLAEQMGIIREIGEWVLATAAGQGRRLHEAGLEELRMNVNVSVSQIRDPVFLEHFTRIIEETGIDLARLGIGIEITESELMENIEDAFPALETFRERGMWIYIDDFGTGYSSLSYLRKLPINSLKIDRSFIQDIPGDSDAVAVVRSIIALARSLGMRVIAEGVETEDQLATLRELGCDAGQGFLFSPPLAAKDLEAFLSKV